MSKSAQIVRLPVNLHSLETSRTTWSFSHPAPTFLSTAALQRDRKWLPLTMQGYSTCQLTVSQSKQTEEGNKEQCREKFCITLGLLLSFSTTSFPLVLLFLNIRLASRSVLFQEPGSLSPIRNEQHVGEMKRGSLYIRQMRT